MTDSGEIIKSFLKMQYLSCILKDIFLFSPWSQKKGSHFKQRGYFREGHGYVTWSILEMAKHSVDWSTEMKEGSRANEACG